MSIRWAPFVSQGVQRSGRLLKPIPLLELKQTGGRHEGGNRHLYGRLISLAEFRAAYCEGGGYCRACGQYQAGVPVKAKGMECPDCRKRRVFSGREYAQNGWIAGIPPGHYRIMAVLLVDFGLPETLPGAAVPLDTNAQMRGTQK